MQQLLFDYEININNKIILLDLNYTLVKNSYECEGPYPNRIYQQKYETELINYIKNNTVILITARPYKYSYDTLNHIKQQTGYEPQDSYWNTGIGKHGMQPPELKEYWLNNAIFKKYGDNPKQYLAIESNKQTRKMYNKYKITAIPKQQLPITTSSHPWKIY